jgi:hypothetical protein
VLTVGLVLENPFMSMLQPARTSRFVSSVLILCPSAHPTAG